ncbi:hypothetical protein [Streptomyces sp. DB-54]
MSAGDMILNRNASGGVGLIAARLGKLADARVIGTASDGIFNFHCQFGVQGVAYDPG